MRAPARQLMGYLGLVPREASSGEHRRQGSITKAGNGYARRALIEAAWAYRHPARVTRIIATRQTGLPKAACDIAWRAPRLGDRALAPVLSGGGLPRHEAQISHQLAGRCPH